MSANDSVSAHCHQFSGDWSDELQITEMMADWGLHFESPEHRIRDRIISRHGPDTIIRWSDDTFIRVFSVRLFRVLIKTKKAVSRIKNTQHHIAIFSTLLGSRYKMSQPRREIGPSGHTENFPD